jgi:hypothetical protein
MQPVVPITINPEWNIITRTIIPVVSQPALFPGNNRVDGIGPAQFSAFLSPAVPKGAIRGVGPVAQIPITSDCALGSYRGNRPDVVILKLEQGSPWRLGARSCRRRRSWLRFVPLVASARWYLAATYRHSTSF